MQRLSPRTLGIGAIALVVMALIMGGLTLGGGNQNPPQATIETESGVEYQRVGMVSPVDAIGMFVKIGFVAVLLGGSLWLLKRYAGPGTRGGGRSGAVRILDMIPLAQGRALYLIDIGDRALLIGATQNQISPIGDVTDEGVLASLREGPRRVEAPFAGFSRKLFTTLQDIQANAQRPRQTVAASLSPSVFAEAEPAVPASFAEAMASAVRPSRQESTTVPEQPIRTGGLGRALAERLDATGRGQ